MFPAATTTVATTTSSATRGATMSFSFVCGELLARDKLSLYCRAISVLGVAELPPFVDHSSAQECVDHSSALDAQCVLSVRVPRFMWQ